MKKHVTWQEIEEYAKQVAEHCKKIGFEPDGIYGPARGAIPFAKLVAEALGIDKFLSTPSKNAIHIDDIADSGITLEAIQRRRDKSAEYTDPTKQNKSKQGNFFMTTMYYHPRSTVIPDFYAHKKSEHADDPGDWLVFPYEEVNQRQEELGQLKTQVGQGGNLDVSWEQIEGFLYETMQAITKSGVKPTGVYGARNGGEIAAVWLSNAFDIDYLDAPCKGCIVIDDFAKENTAQQYKDCHTISMFGQKDGDGGMFKVANYDGINLPYKKAQTERSLERNTKSR